MKFRTLAHFLAVAFLLAGIATAQTKSTTEKPAPPKRDTLSLVKTASNVAANTQQDLDGFLAVYVDQESWASALKDGDLGPFLKIKDQKAGRSAVLIFSSKKDEGLCVFFDGDSPFGMTSAVAKNGKIEAGDISSGYKPVSKEMLKDSGQEYIFSTGDLATDDGQPLPGYQITRASKKPAN